MRNLVDLLKRFRNDDRGAFALIFGAMAIVLVAMAGAAVDFTSIQQARTRAQVALDAAALALQPTIYSASSGTIQSQAQALLVDQLADAATTWANCATNGNKAPCATVTSPDIDTTDGQLTLVANLTIPMNFVSLVGVQTITAQIESVATRKKLNLEVALVLDNSGSMGTSFGSGTRLTTLQSSAKCAANILFYGVKTCSASVSGMTANPNVKMAIVPFNDEVNVGVSNAMVGGTPAAWIDDSNVFDNDNFDNDDYTPTAYAGPTDRIGLFSKIKDKYGNALSWGGCVEARINNGTTEQYDTDDTTPDITKPDTLFTPLFAPDEPDSGGYSNNYISDTPSACNWTGTCTVVANSSTTATKNVVTTTTVTTVTVRDNNNNVISGPTTTTTGPTTTTSTPSSTTSSSNATFTATFGTQQSGPGICSCPSGTASTTVNGTVTNAGPTTTTETDGPTTTSQTTGKNKNRKTTTTVTTTTTKTVSTATTTPSTATTSCSGQTYKPTGLSARVLQERLCKYNGSQMSKSVSLGFGPNADCPASAIQPLTTDPGTITTAVNSMKAGGNTNIQEGSAWGFRVLSPTEPFTQGNPYDNATSKAMIVMTDGENTYDVSGNMNGTDLYAAYAYPWDNYKDSAPKVSRGRLGDVGWSSSQFVAQINSRFATTCTNAKKAGITIYTIGLATNATSDPAGNKALLTNCASDPTYAYFPTTASDLQDAFSDIANQLAALRLAK